MAEFHPLTTTHELVAAAAREGLDLTPDAGPLDTMGLDFLVVHGCDAAGTRWIVRSPRRADVIAGATREATALRVVAPALAPLHIAVPDWRIHAPDVIAYPRLDATPALTLETGAPVWNIIDPTALAPTFLESHAQLLHAFARIDDAGLRHKSLADSRAEVADGIAAAQELLDPDPAYVARWEAWLARDWPTHTAFSHGDLHPGHLLLAPDARIVGVLDWTEAAVGDPSIDLAMVKMCYGRPALEQIAAHMTALGTPVPPSLVAHAVERCAAFPALGAAWARRTGNLGMVDYLKSQLAVCAT
jgi:aminoglycoside phosphotransferase (APT) family kinase protein